MGSMKKKYHKLVAAIVEEDYDEFKYRWNDKFDLKYADAEGRTLLHWATYASVVNIARFLVEHGAGVETEDGEGGTPLSCAAANGDIDLTAMYLDKKANPNGVRRSANPLMKAAEYGHHAVVALLLERGANANAVDEVGHTALIYAAMKGRYFAAKTLLEHGASTEAQTDGTQTDANGCPHSESTPLHWAVQEEFPEIVRLLLEYGADVEAADDSITPLSAAAAAGVTEIFAILLQKAVNINGSATVQSPLVMAVAFQHHPIVELLIAREVDVNITDSEGETVLMNATHQRDLPMMQLLLDAGADTSITNDNGETALEAAKAGKFKKGVALLKSYAKP